MKRICIVVGARPNFMKVAPLIRAIGKTDDVDFQLVYTGREDDPKLEASLFDDLQMPRPDYYLGADAVRLNELTAQVIGSFDAYVESHPTDVVIVVDDLAATMAVAITAKKLGLKLAHLVAGTRSFDINMPKEINRLVIDALSDYLFTAGVKSSSVATREQQSEKSQTFMVGNILIDTLRYNSNRLRQPAIGVDQGRYFVLTVNRRDLLADEQKLGALMQAADVVVPADLQIVLPLHSEPRAVVERIVHQRGFSLSKWRPIPTLSYLEFGWLTAHAKGVVTDSGNVAEEATWNHVPCVTLNDYVEHLETVEQGTNELVGEDAGKLAYALQRIVAGQWKHGTLPERWDGRTAERIVSILINE